MCNNNIQYQIIKIIYFFFFVGLKLIYSQIVIQHLSIESSFHTLNNESWISLDRGNDAWNCTESFPCKSIQKAVNVTLDGGYVYLEKSNSLNYTCEVYDGILISKKLSIIGINKHFESGDTRVVIDCKSHGRSFQFQGISPFERNFISVENIEFIGGSNSNGGCIYAVNASIFIKDCNFNNNYASENGGAIYIQVHKNDTQTKFENCNFLNNRAFSSGGGIYIEIYGNNNSNIMSNSYFLNNTIEFSGEGSGSEIFIFSQGTNHLNYFDNCLFSQKNEDRSMLLIEIEGNNCSNHFENCILNSSASQGNNGGLILSSTGDYNSNIIKNSSFYSMYLNRNGFLSIFLDGNYSLNRIEKSNFFNSTSNADYSINFDISGSNVFTLIDNCNFLNTGTSLLSVNGMNVTTLFSNCNFLNNTADSWGGSLYVEIYGIHNSIGFDHCSFSNNTANFGGTVSIVTTGNYSSAFFENCSFINNTAFFGGAIYFSAPSDMNMNDCQNHYREWQYFNLLNISNSQFSNNKADCEYCSGGALYIINGLLTVMNSEFTNNFAQQIGGSVYMEATSSLILVDSNFNVDRNVPISLRGQFIYFNSEGNFQSLNSSFFVNYTMNFNSILEIPYGSRFIFDDFSQLICPIGHQIGIDNILGYPVHLNLYCSYLVSSSIYTCIPCPVTTYNLNSGMVIGNKTQKIECMTCPYGGDCTNGGAEVKSKQNFWGQETNPRSKPIQFIQCPEGRCCLNSTCSPYNFCSGEREGILCGRCKLDYCEVFGSTECRKCSECGKGFVDQFFWYFVVLFVILFSIWIFFQPPLITILWKLAFWKKVDLQSSNNSTFGSSLKKIVFYFYQIVFLFFITSNPIVLLQQKLKSFQYMITSFIEITNFQLGSSSGICPKGMEHFNPVTKMLSQITLPFFIMFTTGIFYILQKFLLPLPYRKSIYEFLASIFEVILLSYSIMASSTFQLLSCVQIGDDKVLFIDGEIQCWQSWQYLLFGFMIIFLIPFPFILWIGSKFLHTPEDNQIFSMKEFLIGCILPLPSLVYWSIKFRTEIKEWILTFFRFNSVKYYSRLSSYSDGEEEETKKNVIINPIKDVLMKSYKEPYYYWESIFIFRRLILTLVATFLLGTVLKLFVLSVVRKNSF